MTRTFNVFADTVVEPDETIVVTATIQNPSACLFDVNGLVGSPSDTAILTILNDDGTFSISSIIVVMLGVALTQTD